MLRLLILVILFTGLSGCGSKAAAPAGTGGAAVGAKIAQPPAVPPKSPGPSA